MVNKEKIKQQAKDYVDRTRPARNRFLLRWVALPFVLLGAGMIYGSLNTKNELKNTVPEPTPIVQPAHVEDTTFGVYRQTDTCKNEYTLQPGDGLFDIVTRRHGLPNEYVNVLAVANDIANSDQIYVGESICLDSILNHN